MPTGLFCVIPITILNFCGKKLVLSFENKSKGIMEAKFQLKTQRGVTGPNDDVVGFDGKTYSLRVSEILLFHWFMEVQKIFSLLE